MDMTAPEGLIEHFSKLEDPRVDRNKKHELIDVVVLCVCAVLSGAEGWSDIEEFGRSKLDWLRRYVPLANGVPVDDTIARIISALSVSGFQECFLGWMEDVVKLSDGEIIALDGKTHRRSHDRKRGVKALHMFSAWACRNGVVLGQVKTDEKSNEITAVPELLEKGVKGMGEGPTTGAPAAVMGAVRDALSTVGTTTIDRPVTPERIWRAIRAASGSPRDAGSGT